MSKSVIVLRGEELPVPKYKLGTWVYFVWENSIVLRQVLGVFVKPIQNRVMYQFKMDYKNTSPQSEDVFFAKYEDEIYDKFEDLTLYLLNNLKKQYED